MRSRSSAALSNLVLMDQFLMGRRQTAITVTVAPVEPVSVGRARRVASRICLIPAAVNVAASPATVVKEKTLHPFFYTAMYAALVVLALILFGLGIFPGIAIERMREFLEIG